MQHTNLIKMRRIVVDEISNSDLLRRNRIFAYVGSLAKVASLQAIAQLFGRNHSSVARLFSLTGGIRPPARKRAASALSLWEREEISRSSATGLSIRAIDVKLNRSPSTISREIRRNGEKSWKQPFHL